MHFWTKDEYLRFSRELRDKPASHMAFEILYWCGLCVGQLVTLQRIEDESGKGSEGKMAI